MSRTKELHHPPLCPGVLPVPSGDTPHVIPAEPSVGDLGHEKEFDDNEDAREPIFRDSEEHRDAEMRHRGDALFHELEEGAANVPPISPLPTRPEGHDQASVIESKSIHMTVQDAPPRHASDTSDTMRREGERMARERESPGAECEGPRLDEERLLDKEREAKIAALENELARTCAELDKERQLRMTEASEARMTAAERDEALRNQRADLANVTRPNQTFHEEKRALKEMHRADNQRRREARDEQIQALIRLVSQFLDGHAATRQREEEQRLSNERNAGIEQVIEHLLRQNAEQREHLNALSDSRTRQYETIVALRGIVNNPRPYNVKSYPDEFGEVPATEVRNEIGKLRQELRNIQHELVMMKYGPREEFDPDGKPWMASGASRPPPPDVPLPLGDTTRPAWRSIPRRSSRRSRKRREDSPLDTPPEPISANSWVTWQPNPALAPTPPSIEPTLLVPDRGSPGLFGPRSPRDSYRG
ncbi:hypothetical protein EV363DRAFT_303962 [Boletus edulis]|nr:hypothetical protein EV363DRAFT_303962 [Boletus edulis]